MSSTDPTAPRLWLACLCAAWCRTCDDYQPVLHEVAAEFVARFPGLQVRWIDIEDEADLVGDFEVETFPTIVVLDAGTVRFSGPVMPQPQTLRRLLRAALIDGAPTAPLRPVPAEVRAFAERLRAVA